MNCNNQDYSDLDCNYILDSIKKIDKMQKEIICEEKTNNRCIMCDKALFTNLYNTIPVALYTCCGNEVTGLLGVGGDTTSYFRIESIRCNRYVTLMLLNQTTTNDVTTLTGSEFTITIDINCIGRIQCFAPINIETCTSSLETL